MPTNYLQMRGLALYQRNMLDEFLSFICFLRSNTYRYLCFSGCQQAYLIPPLFVWKASVTRRLATVMRSDGGALLTGDLTHRTG